MKQKLWAELFLFFGAIPLLMAVLSLERALLMALWIATFCIGYSYHKRKIELREFWNAKAVAKAPLIPVFWLWLACMAFLAFAVWLLLPERFLSFPLERPGRWALVMVLYPIVSVLPQEIIFRVFFFRRYAPLFGEKCLPLASGLIFGFAHIILLNWVAVVLSSVGGYIFARTYAKTRSLALVCLEHTLYGCLVFTVGLGPYFYHAAER